GSHLPWSSPRGSMRGAGSLILRNQLLYFLPALASADNVQCSPAGCTAHIRWRDTVTIDLAKAKAFVKSVDLGGTPRGILAQGPATEAGEVFDQAKKQAQVVGSGVFSFAEGVDASVREAISDSALLAQLVANKRVAFDKDPRGWFKTYSEVLQNVGWTLQD